MKSLDKNKYGNIKTHTEHGFLFDSKLESAGYGYLLLLQQNKEIKNIRVKPNITLTEAKIRMIPDFVAFHIEMGQDVYYELKGFETDVWRIKLRLWKVYGPGPLQVIRGTYKKLLFDPWVIPSCKHQSEF